VGGDGDEEDMGEEADEEQRRKDVMTTLVSRWRVMNQGASRQKSCTNMVGFVCESAK
jgi:hypothetical protein